MLLYVIKLLDIRKIEVRKLLTAVELKVSISVNIDVIKLPKLS
jgi:hypothetical protein